MNAVVRHFGSVKGEIMTRAAFASALLGLILVSVTVGHGQEKQKTPGDNAWTVDDVVLAEEAVGMRIAPDGKHAVWIKRVPDKEKTR